MYKTLLAVALPVCLAAPAALAQTEDRAPFIYAVKGGWMQPDGDDNDSAFNLAGTVGQRLHRDVSWEAELSLSVADGEVGNDDNWDITSVAGYAVYRSPTRVSFKARMGLAWWDAGDDSDVSLSMGLGLSTPAGRRGRIEAEFTEIDDGVDFISIGYVFEVD